MYRHRRLDTNEIFYIGIGNIKRAYNTYNRNIVWKRIVNKTNYQVEIIVENLDWETACELEQLLILEYGRRNLKTGPLCNMTDGGEGTLGIKHTVERNMAIAKRQRERVISEETRLKIRNTLKNGKSSWIGNVHNNKKVIDTITGIIYKSIKEVSILFEIKYTTLKQNLSGYRTNKTIFKYYIEE